MRLHWDSIMASSVETVESRETAKASLPFVPLVAAMVIAVAVGMAALGGAFYWLMRSGRLPAGSAGKPPAAARTEAPKTHEVTLDPLLVNLADAGGHAYLRIGITLKVADEIAEKGAKPKEEEKPVKGAIEHNAEVRDAALQVLGAETSDALLAPDGKDRVKGLLKTALAQRVPEMKVADVYFTEFLVQR